MLVIYIETSILVIPDDMALNEYGFSPRGIKMSSIIMDPPEKALSYSNFGHGQECCQSLINESKNIYIEKKR